MSLEISSNSSEREASSQESLSNPTLDIALENSDQENNEDPGYDEPRCNWTPTGHSDDDCGEGVICPPCN
jgi:hypothetical protein